MVESPGLTSRPGKIPSAMAWAAHSMLGAIIATSVALVVYVVIGLIAWAAIRGYEGIGLCAAMGLAAGVVLRGPGSRPARVLGGGMGAAIAGYAALSTGEMFPPATMQWALAGTAYGALFGLPVAALVGGLVGLLGALCHRWGFDHAATADEGRPADQGHEDRR